MAKIRTHNEWVREVSLGNRKSCPTCHTKKTGQLYSWGEYSRGKWYTVKHFCQACFPSEVRDPLLAHAGPCACEIELQCKDMHKPDWLTLTV